MTLRVAFINGPTSGNQQKVSFRLHLRISLSAMVGLFGSFHPWFLHNLLSCDTLCFFSTLGPDNYVEEDQTAAVTTTSTPQVGNGVSFWSPKGPPLLTVVVFFFMTSAAEAVPDTWGGPLFFFLYFFARNRESQQQSPVWQNDLRPKKFGPRVPNWNLPHQVGDKDPNPIPGLKNAAGGFKETS